LHYAKNKGGVRPHSGDLLPGFQASVLFNNLSGWKLKILIPQNVVATHPSIILHIEIFSAIRFDLKQLFSARRVYPSITA